MPNEEEERTLSDEEETCPRCNGTGQIERIYKSRKGDLESIRALIRRHGTIRGRELNRSVADLLGVEREYARKLAKRAIDADDQIRRLDGMVCYVGVA